MIRSAAGPVSYWSYSYSLIGYNKLVGRWVAVRQDGGFVLSISRSFVCGIIRVFSVLWSFRVRFPDPARMSRSSLPRKRMKERCRFISRKSRYFVFIDPMKAECEGRRETTDTGSRQSVPQEDDGKILNLIASSRPSCTDRETFRYMRTTMSWITYD